ncbi:MAG: transcription antitermination factor NusB [Desulfovibrionaceae bacterium]|nr:transcription antitermination factor NusB [Desulfovibrionaceae bacterium]
MAQSRHSQRQTAFQTLYSLYFSPAYTLAELQDRFLSQPSEKAPAQPAGDGQEEGQRMPSGFAWDLVRGVWENSARLDALIMDVANRGMERIGRIEQVVLRLASYEMLTSRAELKITLSEAVILANEFGDTRSRQFINGILNGISRKVQQDNLTLDALKR